jgi:hypothetical protein
LSSRDGRTITMADQMDSDSTPQRKRIAVAVRRYLPSSFHFPRHQFCPLCASPSYFSLTNTLGIHVSHHGNCLFQSSISS